MIIIFTVLGALLGIISVMFFFQNVVMVTVSFMAWQMTGSLAIMLFLAMMSGITVTLLLLLPSFIRNDFRLSRMRKQVRNLEDEHARLKIEAERPREIVTPTVQITEA